MLQSTHAWYGYHCNKFSIGSSSGAATAAAANAARLSLLDSKSYDGMKCMTYIEQLQTEVTQLLQS